MEGRAMEIEARAESLAMALGELSKWGYQIVRDDDLANDGPEREYQTDLAACALLGLEATAANIASHPVSLVAQALAKAVADHESTAASAPVSRMVQWKGISGRTFLPEQSTDKDSAE